MQESRLSPVHVEKFVRNKIDHSYNKEVFDQQLNEEIQRNLTKMQKNIVKELKRKLIIKQQQQSSLQQRERIKKQLQQKFIKSKQIREKKNQQKHKLLLQDQKYKKELFKQRLQQLKKHEKQRRLQVLQIIESKDKKFPTYNKLNRAVSLLQQPHYKRKIQLQQNQYNIIKQNAQRKDIFRRPALERRQLSMVEIKPRQSIYGSKEQDNINKIGEHLQRIQQSRKKKEQIINQRIQKMKYLDKQSTQQRNQRLKLLLQSQKKKQQNLINKLSKSVTSSLSTINHSSLSKLPKNPESTQSLRKGSVIYEQGQDREKHSYRRQIKQQIRQYMLKQKQKLLKQQ